MPAPVNLTAIDHCDGNITAIPVDKVTAGTCANNFTILRSWTFTDACGNSSSVSQSITVNDNTPPVISGVPSLPVRIPFTDAGQCSYTAKGKEFDVAATDNCSGNVFLIYQLSGATSGSGSGTLAGVQLNFGETTVVWTASDGCSNSATGSFKVIVDKIKTITTVSVDPVSQQYSDLVKFKATISPWNCTNGGNAGGKVTFYVGTQAMGASVPIGSDGTATVSYPLVEFPTSPSNGQMAPGNHTVLAHFISTNLSYDIQDKTTSLTITQENMLVEYAGSEIQATQSSTSSKATVELRAVIHSVADSPGLKGDVRRACVSFKIGNLIIGPITPQLINSGDLSTGVVIYKWLADIGSADFVSYDVKVLADCYYTGEDQTVVTVYKPVGDFIAGGGDIKPTLSSGTYASTPGQKTNFGFQVKFNKAGANLQGGMNIIFRKKIGDQIQLYQIKTNSMTSLGVNSSNSDSKTGVFTSKASLKNLSTGESLGGNLQLQVKVTDRGEQGTNDDIAITLLDGNLLLYSSKWTGKTTAQQLLSVGNIVVHSGFDYKSDSISTGILELPDSFDVEMYPNPSKGEVILDVSGSQKMNSEVVVRSLTGSEVFRKEYIPSEQIKLDLSKLVSGTYLVTLEINGNQIVKKLILDKN